MQSMECSAILLAAGQSRRMGQNKLFLPFGDGRLIDRSLALLQALDQSQRIIVLSEENAARLGPPVGAARLGPPSGAARLGPPSGAARLDAAPAFEVLINPAPERGQGGSVALGAAAARGELLLFLAADQPFLDMQTLAAILAAARSDNIVIPTAAGQPGHPVCFGRAFRAELAALDGPEGGRVVMGRHRDACLHLPIENALALQDADSPEAYQALLSIWESQQA